MKFLLLNSYINLKLILALFIVTLLFVSILTTSKTVIGASYLHSSSADKNNMSSNKDASEFSIIPNPVNQFILNQIVNKSKAALVVGFVDPNGTKVFSFGNISKANNIPVNGNTLFNIGSITKIFTTLILADFVKKGIVNLDDPIEKYLPSNITVPSYKGHKITLENLATHTSGLPEFPPNIWLNNEHGVFKQGYDENQLYKGLSNVTLTREPGSQFQYSSFGSALLAHILSLKAGGNDTSFENLVKDKVLNVLGMNDTKITLSQSDIKNRFPIGHDNGSEINTPEIPQIMAGSGALRSTANDMLKFVSANLGLIHTILDDSMQLQQLILHSGKIANPMNFSEYTALGWRVLTNFGSETFTHTGSVNGWNAFIGFTPSKQTGLVLLCSCDSQDADMGSLGFVLLHLTGIESMTKKIESLIHTTTSPN